MTSQAIARYWEEPLGRFRLRPAEGWLTVAMVVLLVEAFVWSIQDAGWVPESQGSTAALVYLALGGIAIELIGAKLGWGRWRTHLVGGVIAGLILPPITGLTVLSSRGPVDVTNLAALYQAAANIGFTVWADLIRDNRPFTTEYGHYHMIFGALVWAAGMLAGSAIFQRRRPFDAVVVVGLLLLASMTATSRGDAELPFLVLFSVAALILLVRAHSFDEQVTWVRRRIGDPASVSALYLRGGATFIGLTVLAALLLTATASSAPLQGLWADLPSKLSGLSDWIQKFGPGGLNVRTLSGASFESTATTIGVWAPATGTAFRAQVPANAPVTPFKWRAGTYSLYDGLGRWSWGDTKTVDVPSGADVLASTTADPAKLAGRQQLVVTVEPDEFRDQTVLSPDTVLSVDRDTAVHLTGDQFTTLAPTQGGGTYKVTALIPAIGGDVGLTQNRLRVTPRSYPSNISRYYLEVKPGSLGPNSLAVYADVKRLAGDAGGPANNPYDFAEQLETYLRSSRFDYQADVRDRRTADCGGLSSAECFATIKQGYCEYYATLMTLLLRHDGIPARIAYGFLGATPSIDGTVIVPAASAHWWVEAYFADYGWVEFDPTGGNVGQPQPLPAGPVETPRPLASSPALGGGDVVDPTRRANSGEAGGGTTTTPTGTGSGPFVVVALLLAFAVLLLALAARRRAPRPPMDPDHAWGGLGRLAGRFGLGPRPAQTVYEYAGSLGDAVPLMRAELSTVARAKVEVAYGRQELPLERLRAVGEAYRRLRFAILRRGLRRWPRRGHGGTGG